MATHSLYQTVTLIRISFQRAFSFFAIWAVRVSRAFGLASFLINESIFKSCPSSHTLRQAVKRGQVLLQCFASTAAQPCVFTAFKLHLPQDRRTQTCMSQVPRTSIERTACLPLSSHIPSSEWPLPTICPPTLRSGLSKYSLR